MQIKITICNGYSEAELTNVPAVFTNKMQEDLMAELNVDILIF